MGQFIRSTIRYCASHRRTNHKNPHIRGYIEKGVTTPFDMTARNDLDRFHLAIDVLDRLQDADDRATHCNRAGRSQQGKRP